MISDFLFNLPVVASSSVLLTALLYLSYRLASRHDIGNCLFWLLWILAVLVDFVLFCAVFVLAIEDIKKLPAPWPTVAVLCALLGLVVVWVIYNRQHLRLSVMVALILAIPFCIISLFSQFVQTEIEKHQPLPLIVIFLLFLIAIWIQSNSPLAEKILNALAGILLGIPVLLVYLYSRAADWWKNKQRNKTKS